MSDDARERELKRIREYEHAIKAFETGEAYQRELNIRRALQVALIPTDVLTALVLPSILADQLADHPPEPLLAMINGMLTTAREHLEAGELCRNDKCRAGLAMTTHFAPTANTCVWCKTPFRGRGSWQGG
jgi:hypothetical protein